MKMGRQSRKFNAHHIRNIDKCRILQKSAGKSVVGNKPLTIPSGFVSFGIKSKLPKKTKDKPTKIFEKKLNNLFSEDSPKVLRRSTRLSNKSKQSDIDIKAPEYYEKLMKQNCLPDLNTDSNKRDSKSLFLEVNLRSKEIEQKVLPTESQPDVTINKPNQKAIFSQYFPLTYICNSNFESVLKSQLIKQVKNESLKLNTEKLFKEITEVNAILTGEVNPKKFTEMNENLNKGSVKRPLTENESSPVHFRLFPPSEWCYKTPPQKMINFNINRDYGLKPAVIQTTQKERSLYEVNKHFKNVDFCKVQNKFQGLNVPIHENYLTHLGNFPTQSENNWNFESRRNNDAIDLTNDETPVDDSSSNLMNVETYQPMSTVEENFANVTGRPSKKLKNLSRIISDINFNQHNIETIDKFNSDFTLINCIEDLQEQQHRPFNFKVPKKVLFQDCEEQPDNIENIFTFEENLFSNDENMFNFGKDENGNVF